MSVKTLKDYGTLRDIALNDLNLSANTLYQVRDRHADFPKEWAMSKHFPNTLYPRKKVVAWYRENIETLPTYNRDGGRATG